VQASPYDLGDIDIKAMSADFQLFVQHYFVDSTGLTRGEVDLAFLERLSVPELSVARDLLRRHLHLRYTHIIAGTADLRDIAAVDDLRALLGVEPSLSGRLTIARALWRLVRDEIFYDFLVQMQQSDSPGVKQAHLDDVLLLADERAVSFLVILLDDADSFVRSMALHHLNCLEHRKHFLLRPEDLPHDAQYYRQHREDGQLTAKLIESMHATRTHWPTVFSR